MSPQRLSGADGKDGPPRTPAQWSAACQRKATVNESDFPTIIGPDANFKGELSFEKSVKVLGSFEGRIITNGSLEVAVGGKIQADIEAGNINVEGDIHGNIAASDSIELKKTARLRGDIRCERLTVVDGAAFVGHCEVGNGVGEKLADETAQSRTASTEEVSDMSEPASGAPLGEGA